MGLFNGKGGTIAKTSAVVGLITAILVLNWNVTDRVKAVAEDAKKDAIAVAKTEDAKIIASQVEDQQRNSLRFWMQQRDLAKIELKRVRRGLVHHPNDLNLLEDLEYWQEMYNKANQELNKLLNP